LKIRRYRVVVVAIVVVAIALLMWRFVSNQAAAPVVAAANAPTVTIRSAPIAKATLVHHVTSFGEVTAGQIVGVSFPRAGQITRLAATVGKRVAKGSMVASLLPDPTSQQAYQQAVTAADLALREWHRQEELLKLQLATQSQLEAAEKSYRDAAGNLKVLSQIGGGSGESVITAPFDCVVISVAAALGDRIAAGAPVLQLGRTDELKINLGVEPADRGLMKVGTAVTLTPLSGESSDTSPITSTISELQDMVDPKSMLVTAVVVVHGPASSRLVAGMKVRASADVSTLNTIAVPRNSILIDEKGSYVFQVRDGKAVRADVKTGLESDGLVAIDGIRDAALPIVVLGNYELEDGMAVKDAAP
jgi:membrane fusion protein (multidrug efflux system)